MSRETSWHLEATAGKFPDSQRAIVDRKTAGLPTEDKKAVYAVAHAVEENVQILARSDSDPFAAKVSVGPKNISTHVQLA